MLLQIQEGLARKYQSLSSSSTVSPILAPRVFSGLLLVTLDPVRLSVCLAMFLHVCDAWYAGLRSFRAWA